MGMPCYLIFITSCICCCTQTVTAQTSQTSDKKAHSTIVVYIDGFAQWFLDRPELNLEGFKQLKKHGQRAEYLVPEFPSVPATNFWSAFTGRFPEEHGLLDDVFWSESRGAILEFNTSKSYKANLPLLSPTQSVEPLWITAMKENITTSLHWWRACPTESSRRRDHHYSCSSMDEHTNFDSIVGKSTEVLFDVKSKKQLIMIIYPQIATTGRAYGPYHTLTQDNVFTINEFLRQVQATISDYDLWDTTNLVVASGNGMSDVAIKNVYFLDDFVDMKLVRRLVGNGGHMWVHPEDQMEYQIYQQLTANLNDKVKHCHVHWKDDFMERWHLKNAVDIPPLMVLCNPGFAVYSRKREKQYPVMPLQITEDYFRKGEYGYDSATPDMKGIFMARGPAFKPDSMSMSLRVADVYFELCHLLELKGCHTRRWGDQLFLSTNGVTQYIYSKISLITGVTLLLVMRLC